SAPQPHRDREVDHHIRRQLTPTLLTHPAHGPVHRPSPAETNGQDFHRHPISQHRTRLDHPEHAEDAGVGPRHRPVSPRTATQKIPCPCSFLFVTVTRSSFPAGEPYVLSPALSESRAGFVHGMSHQ